MHHGKNEGSREIKQSPTTQDASLDRITTCQCESKRRQRSIGECLAKLQGNHATKSYWKAPQPVELIHGDAASYGNQRPKAEAHRPNQPRTRVDSYLDFVRLHAFRNCFPPWPADQFTATMWTDVLLARAAGRAERTFVRTHICLSVVQENSPATFTS